MLSSFFDYEYENIKKDFSIGKDFYDTVFENNTVFCRDPETCFRCTKGQLVWEEIPSCKGLSCNPWRTYQLKIKLIDNTESIFLVKKTITKMYFIFGYFLVNFLGVLTTLLLKSNFSSYKKSFSKNDFLLQLEKTVSAIAKGEVKFLTADSPTILKETDGSGIKMDFNFF